VNAKIHYAIGNSHEISTFLQKISGKRNVEIEGNGEVKEPKADNIEAPLAMNTNEPHNQLPDA
jgi:hypothetical protein